MEENKGGEERRPENVETLDGSIGRSVPLLYGSSMGLTTLNRWALLSEFLKQEIHGVLKNNVKYTIGELGTSLLPRLAMSCGNYHRKSDFLPKTMLVFVVVADEAAMVEYRLYTCKFGPGPTRRPATRSLGLRVGSGWAISAAGPGWIFKNALWANPPRPISIPDLTRLSPNLSSGPNGTD
ncbi:hypothetical protein PanWU01x14_128080 [Parasponia andersonii]|uniref:Uncharacterized protein n=1 Tax=Parasponia andersonii TaxID=3476 RepID=A0A2P5CS24_PARAD|nr:hypothetical protein PanWU01x14_128080 [Parasponia andersonii]